MEISGKITKALPLQTGQGKNGMWKKQEYIIEIPGSYPKNICFSVWGEKIDQFGLTVGEQVQVSIDLESREYNGRWYTEVKAWKTSKSSGVPTMSESTMQPNSEVDYSDTPF